MVNRIELPVAGNADATHIDRLELTDFRLFNDLMIEFDEELTVLVANNGDGKTAVLEAIAVALAPFFDKRGIGEPSGFSWGADDIRRVFTADQRMEPMASATVAADLVVAGRRLRSTTRIGDLKGQSTELMDLGYKLRNQVAQHAAGKQVEPPLLPLFAYYPVNRAWGTTAAPPRRKADSTPNARTRGYAGALAGSAGFRAFTDWFRGFAVETEKEARGDAISERRLPALMMLVQRAIAFVLQPTRWAILEWDLHEDRAMLRHPTHGTLPVDVLSAGLRTMVGLAGDLSRRAILLNPHLETKACDVPGIVLIDEIDMHLHPEWQQVIIERLRAAFPRVQFVVTTHSPQVLSTVRRQCIRIIEEGSGADWLVRRPDEQTEGVASALVLASVMGVDATPDNEHVRRLREYGSLIGAGHADRDDARALRDLLDAHFGPQSAVMLECDRVIRLEAMKRRLLRREGA